MRALLFFIFLFASALLQAQVLPKKAFSVGLELGIPSNSVYTIGFGGSGKTEVPVTGPVRLTVTAGYSSLYFKNSLIGSSTTQPAAGFAPLKAGIKYYFNQGVYAEAEAGNVFETNYGKGNLFVFAVGPGLIAPIGDHSGLDIGFRYENWGNGRIKQTAFRVAYRLGW